MKVYQNILYLLLQIEKTLEANRDIIFLRNLKNPMKANVRTTSINSKIKVLFKTPSPYCNVKIPATSPSAKASTKTLIKILNKLNYVYPY